MADFILSSERGTSEEKNYRLGGYSFELDYCKKERLSHLLWNI
jgi:hypothetical protein